MPESNWLALYCPMAHFPAGYSRKKLNPIFEALPVIKKLARIY
jgi:hypothetical protein